MNPKLSFYALIASLTGILAVVSAAQANVVNIKNSEQTIEQRVNRVRNAVEKQDNRVNIEQPISEDKHLISQWYNNWTNDPWENWYNTNWYNNWTNYNGG